jgi:hypothetical protein
MVAGDGRLFLSVASHPFGPIKAGDEAFRFGRIGFPALAWLVVLGHRNELPAGLVIVNVVATALLAGGVAALAKSAGGDPRGGLLVLALPVVWAVTRFSYGDTVAATLAVVGCVAWSRNKMAVGWLCFALAALSRETMLLALVPPIVDGMHRRQPRRVIVWLSAAVPLLVWWSYVRTRFGEWPPLAHTINRSAAISLPFVGMFKADGAVGYRVAVVFGVATILLAAATAVFLRVGNPAWGYALTFGMFAVCFGPNVLAWWGDTLRLLLPAHLFLLPGAIAAAPRIKQRLLRSAPADQPAMGP